MKFILKLVFIILISTILIYYLFDNDGLIMVLKPPYKIELSLNLVLLSFVAFILIFFYLSKAIQRLLSLPKKLKILLNNKKEKSELNNIFFSLKMIIVGDYNKSISYIDKISKDKEKGTVKKILSSIAYHKLGKFEKRDDLLELKKESEDKEILKILKLIFLIDQGLHYEALSIIKTINKTTGFLTKLEIESNEALKNWNDVLVLSEISYKKNILSQEYLRKKLNNSIINIVSEENLDFGKLKRMWSKLSTDSKSEYTSIKTFYLKFLKLGHSNYAFDIISFYLNREFDESIIYLLYEDDKLNTKKKLVFLENLAGKNPESKVLLFLLGKIFFENSLWGKAEKYLIKCYKIEDSVEVLLLLSELYDNIENDNQSEKFLQLAKNKIKKTFPRPEENILNSNQLNEK